MIQRTVMGLVCSAAVAALGCGPMEYAVTGSDRVAGADGMIRVEDIAGGNKMVSVDMEHLAPPDRLGEGLTTYVMWFVGEGEGAEPAMVSVLEYDPDDRTATGTATTPMQQFEVRITAELSRSVTSPSDVLVAQREIR